jgi:predicted permease
MEVLTSLFTIFIIVLMGLFSRRFEIFQPQHAKTISSFVYYFGLPTLFFVKISNLDLLTLDPHLVLGVLLPTIIILVVLLVLKQFQLITKDIFILLGLSVSFGSYAFFGVAFFETFQEGIWLETSILAASLLGVLGIVSTLLLLEYANQRNQSLQVLGKIFSNPLIISILAGAVFSLLGIHLDFLKNAFDLVGQTSSALAIFVLGMFIYDRFSWEILKESLLYSLFRMVALPLTAWLVIQLFIPGGGELNQFLMLENSMPAAIALVVFAERYDYMVTETAGIVSLTSILSFPILTGIYYLSLVVF